MYTTIVERAGSENKDLFSKIELFLLHPILYAED